MQAAVSTVAADTLGTASTTLPEVSQTSQLRQEAKGEASGQPADKTEPLPSKESQPKAVLDPQKAAEQAWMGSSVGAQAEPGSGGGAEGGVGGEARGRGSTGGQIPRGGDEALQDALQAEAQRKEQAAADAAAQGQGVHCVSTWGMARVEGVRAWSHKSHEHCGAAGLYVLSSGNARG